GSPRLLQIRKQLYDLSERYRKMESALVPRDRNPNDEHRRIAEAAVERDIPLAVRLMRAHIELTTENIVKAMEKRSSKGAPRGSAAAAPAPRNRPSRSVKSPKRVALAAR